MPAARIISFAFARSYWTTMRPYLLFVSGITGMAGLSFAPPLHPAETLALFLVFFLSYGFGQALTDCFQTDTDAISSPYRPLVRGMISRQDVLYVSLLSLTLCGAVLAWFSLPCLALAVLCTAGLATYTFFKRRWWGGPWYNGWIVAVLFLIGFEAGLRGTDFGLSQRASFAIISVFFGYANFVLVGYFKDVKADTRTGYETLVVKFGRGFSAAASDLLAIVFCITGAAAVMLFPEEHSSASAILVPSLFLAAALAASLRTQFRLHRVRSDEEAYRAVAPSVHTYILMLCAIISANKAEWTAGLIVFYVGFAATLSVRPEPSQI